MPSCSRGSVVQWLVTAAKADVEAKDLHGRTALMFAVFSHHVKVAKWLTRHANADVHVVGAFGTAVDLARRAGAAIVLEGAADEKLAAWLSLRARSPAAEYAGASCASVAS